MTTERIQMVFGKRVLIRQDKTPEFTESGLKVTVEELPTGTVIFAGTDMVTFPPDTPIELMTLVFANQPELFGSVFRPGDRVQFNPEESMTVKVAGEGQLLLISDLGVVAKLYTPGEEKPVEKTE